MAAVSYSAVIYYSMGEFFLDPCFEAEYLSIESAYSWATYVGCSSQPYYQRRCAGENQSRVCAAFLVFIDIIRLSQSSTFSTVLPFF